METLFLDTVDDAINRVVIDEPPSDRAGRFAALLDLTEDIAEHHSDKYSVTATAANWFRLARSVKKLREALVDVNAATGGDPTQVAPAIDAFDNLVDELDLIRELAKHLESVRGRPGSVSEDLAALKRFRREVRSAFDEALREVGTLTAL